MIVFLNGKFVPQSRATVSVFDRGFLYGDGLFETMRVVGGNPFRWREHWARLSAGAKFLKIRLPYNQAVALRHVIALIRKNKMPDSILRLSVSRGIGVRGYSPKGATRPTLVMTLHEAPKIAGQLVQWKLVTSSFRLPAGERLARYKTANKLPQVLARAEADAAGANEALLLNTDGFVVEGASSNLFWIEGRTVCTPPVAGGILSGVTREVVREICGRLKISFREKNIRPKDLKRAGGVFLTLSTLGVVEAVSLDRTRLKRSPFIRQIGAAYNEMLVSKLET
ncbi:MAG TPA: aminodeoxychorismate lyase [Verrucomicrobiae bacterium]|jgi:aminodeoxychorismate lyase